MKTLFKGTSILAALFLSMSVQADFVDFFTEPAGGQKAEDTVVGAGGDFNESANFPTTILGGYRDLYAETTGADFAATTTTIETNNGFLSFSTGSGVTGTATVQWDGNDGASTLDKTGLQTIANPDGEDLVNQDGCPAGGCDRFRFSVFSSDGGIDPNGLWAFTIGLYTDANNFTEFDLVATQVIPPATIVSELLFSDFTENVVGNVCGGGVGDFTNPAIAAKRCGGTNDLAGGQTVDVTKLGAMFITFNVDNPITGLVTDIDLSIGSITKTGVPEPGILGLMGLGLAALGLVRRSRKGKA